MATSLQLPCGTCVTLGRVPNLVNFLFFKKIIFFFRMQDGLELLLLLLRMLIDFVWYPCLLHCHPGVKHTSGTEWTQWGKQPSKWGSTSSQAKHRNVRHYQISFCEKKVPRTNRRRNRKPNLLAIVQLDITKRRSLFKTDNCMFTAVVVVAVKEV